MKNVIGNRDNRVFCPYEGIVEAKPVEKGERRQKRRPYLIPVPLEEINVRFAEIDDLQPDADIGSDQKAFEDEIRQVLNSLGVTFLRDISKPCLRLLFLTSRIYRSIRNGSRSSGVIS